MSVYKTIKRFKNRLFYGSDVSPLEYKDDNQVYAPSPDMQINIDGENDDLSNDPFYGDEAIEKRIEEQTNDQL